MALTPRFEPGAHWWKASALNIAPSLAPPRMKSSKIKLKQLNVMRLQVLDKFIVESNVLCTLLCPGKWSLFETSHP